MPGLGVSRLMARSIWYGRACLSWYFITGLLGRESYADARTERIMPERRYLYTVYSSIHPPTHPPTRLPQENPIQGRVNKLYTPSIHHYHQQHHQRNLPAAKRLGYVSLALGVPLPSPPCITPLTPLHSTLLYSKRKRMSFRTYLRWYCME